MAKVKAGRLLQRVMEKVASTTHWFETLPTDYAEEVFDLRERFRSGQLTGKPYVIAAEIIADGTEQGLRMPSEKAVVTWLKSKD